MRAPELVTWSMALGAIAAIACARFAAFAARPSLKQLQAVGYHFGVLVFVLVLCGVPRETLMPEPGAFHTTQVLAGPALVALSNLWIQGWLAAHQRDRFMAMGLNASAVLLPAAAFGVLALPLTNQLPAAAGLSLAGATLTFWMTLRGWLMGDRLGPAMALGCLLTLPAIAGLYAHAMDFALPLALQAATALCAALSSALTGFALWRRDRHEWKSREPEGGQPRFDPVTRLDTGVGLVRRLIGAQRRRRRMRRDGAVLAVVIYDVDRITAVAGAGGLNEVYIGIARRIQRQVGVVNPVGRYWERCFVTMVESIHSPSWMRTLGLRVAASLRKPFEVTGTDGRRIDVRADIGVGVVHLGADPLPVEDVLHQAEQMADAARAMPSRAAMQDPANGEVVPVEEASLTRRQRQASRRRALEDVHTAVTR